MDDKDLNIENESNEDKQDEINVSVDSKDLEKEIKELVETVKEVQSNSDTSETDEKLDNLIDLMSENQEIERDLHEQEMEKLDLFEKMLDEDEELTEEEQIELDELLQTEQDFEDLQTEYFFNNLSNDVKLIKIHEDNEQIIDHLEMIIQQNEISNHADHVISIYGTMVIPAIVIVLFFYRFLKWFT